MQLAHGAESPVQARSQQLVQAQPPCMLAMLPSLVFPALCCSTGKAGGPDVLGLSHAGREAAGKAYRLYTEASHSTLAAERTPEILRADLATVALQLKALGVCNVLKFPFLDPPPVVAVARALELLLALGALDKQVLPGYDFDACCWALHVKIEVPGRPCMTDSLVGTVLSFVL